MKHSKTEKQPSHRVLEEVPEDPPFPNSSFQIKLQLATVPEFCAANPNFKENTIRKFIFRDQDGFRTECVCQIGRKVFINVGKVDDWILKKDSRDQQDSDSSTRSKKSKNKAS